MNNKRTLSVILLVVACIFGAFWFKFVKSNHTPDIKMLTNKTHSNIQTNSTKSNTNAVSKSMTEYYDENGQIQFVLNTKTEFNSAISNNVLNTKCKCTADYNNQTATQIFQTNTVFDNGVISQDSVEEASKKCINDCVQYGAEIFFGKD